MNKLLALLALLLCSASSVAATYYVDDSAATDSGNGTIGNPKKYLSSGIALMSLSGGDTLIIKPGTYSNSADAINSVRPGTSGAWNVIKAETDGTVIITRNISLGFANHYIQFEGLRWEVAENKTFTGRYVKIFRCAFRGGGPSGNTATMTFGSNDNTPGAEFMLLEDSWVYGPGGRYKVQIYNANSIVLRRVVTRHDAGWSTTNSDPAADIVTYDSQNVALQNVIGIDGAPSITNYAAAFYTNTNNLTSNPVRNVAWQGCIAVSPEGGNGWGHAMDGQSAPSNFSMTDCAFYDTSFGITQTENANNALYTRMSVVQTDGNGIGVFSGSATVRDSVVVASANSAYSGVTPQNSPSYATLAAASTAGLKYLPRIETGSALASGGFSGGQRGARIVKRIGVSGTLYGETDYNVEQAQDLWPWPNEARIKTEFAEVSTRGFAGSSLSLTDYIWSRLGNPSPIGGGGPAAPTVNLTTSNANPILGQAFTLTWVTTDATACTASGGPAGSAWTVPSTAKNPAGGSEVLAGVVTATFTLTCTGPGGTSFPSSRLVSVASPIVSLSAAPLAIYQGSQTTVTWSATNATSCTASSNPVGNWTGAKTATIGPHTENVTLAVSSGLSLTCTSTAGSTTPPAVSVNASPLPPPPVIALSASPQTVTAGNASTISWNVTGVVGSCTGSLATQGNFAGWNATQAVPSGTFPTGNLAATAPYRLTCTGVGGTSFQDQTITVNAALPEPTATITITPPEVLAGYPYTLMWDSTNAASCTATGAWSGAIAVRGTLERTDTPPLTYGLTCTNATGSASDSTDINLTPTVTYPVTVQFVGTVGGSYGVIANGSTHPTGTVIRLTWLAAGSPTATCAATGDWVAAGLSNAGEHTMPALAGDLQVTMTCTNGTTTAVQTLNFYEEDIITPPPAPTLTFYAAPLNILQGGTSRLYWDSTNALSCQASNGWSGVKGVDGEEQTIPLGRTTRFNLTCTGEGGTVAKETAVSVRWTQRWPWCRWWRCR